MSVVTIGPAANHVGDLHAVVAGTATALVHEAYLKLSGQEDLGPESLRTERRDWSYAQAWLNRELEVTV